MPTSTMRVRAVGDGLLPLIDPETHATLMGRYCGRSKDHKPLPEGEVVPAISYYHAAVAQGDLEIVEEPKPMSDDPEQLRRHRALKE